MHAGWMLFDHYQLTFFFVTCMMGGGMSAIDAIPRSSGSAAKGMTADGQLAFDGPNAQEDTAVNICQYQLTRGAQSVLLTAAALFVADPTIGTLLD